MVKAISFYKAHYYPPTGEDVRRKPLTPWRDVCTAQSHFTGHVQPHAPRDLGYYDLRVPEALAAQVDLARAHGVQAFCFDFHWYRGQRAYELPLDAFVARKELDLGFCVAWSNDAWTSPPLAEGVTLDLTHDLDDDRAFIERVLPLMHDSRYVRIDGAPLLLVYRADRPFIREAARLWRERARATGLPDLHLVCVQRGAVDDPRLFDFDAALELPPYGALRKDHLAEPMPTLSSPSFQGAIFDYRKIVAAALARPLPHYRWYRSVLVGLDETPARGEAANVVIGATPAHYQYWLRRVIEQTKRVRPPGQQLVFLNAWNDWSNGCHLEPDMAHGDAYLQATALALGGAASVTEAVEQLRHAALFRDDAAKELIDVFDANERSIIALQQELLRRDQELRAFDDVRPYLPLVRRMLGGLGHLSRARELAEQAWARMRAVR
jgi:hypothetical protein